MYGRSRVNIGKYVLVVLFLLGLVVAAGVSFQLLQRSTDNRSQAAGVSESQLLQQDAGYRGFNTQLRFKDASKSGLTKDAFYAMVDDISRSGVPKPMVRVTINADEAFPRTDLTTSKIQCDTANGAKIVNCNPAVITAYQQALSYAKSKGIKIFLMTYVSEWATVYSNVPDQDKSWRVQYSLQEYRTIAQAEHRILAEKLGSLVSVWNIFNESNIYAFDTHQVVDAGNSSGYQNYMTMFKTVFQDSKQVIKQRNPTTIVTHDMSGAPSEKDATYSSWEKFVKNIAPDLDLLSLNIYPDKQEDVIFQLTDRILGIKGKFGLPVAVSETGMCVADKNSEQDQAAYLPAFIQFFSIAKPYALLVYEYQDDATVWENACAKAFGVKTTTGQARPAYAPVLRALRGETVVQDSAAKLACTEVSRDDFNWADNSTIDWNKWGAANKAHVVSSGNLGLKNDDWIISSVTLPSTFQIDFSLGSFALDKEWGAVKIDLMNATTNQSLYAVILLKESFGYTFQLWKDGVSQKSQYIGNNFGTPPEFSIVKNNSTLSVVMGGHTVGLFQNFTLSNLSSESLKYGVLVTASPNAKTEVKLNTIVTKKCQ